MSSTKGETTFTNYVNNLVSKQIYRMKNNNPYVSGVPDVYYSGPTGDLWIEYKFITLPKRDTSLVDIGLSPLQLEWCTQRAKENRNVRIVVGFNFPTQRSKHCLILHPLKDNEVLRSKPTRLTVLAKAVAIPNLIMFLEDICNGESTPTPNIPN